MKRFDRMREVFGFMNGKAYTVSELNQRVSDMSLATLSHLLSYYHKQGYLIRKRPRHLKKYTYQLSKKGYRHLELLSLE